MTNMSRHGTKAHPFRMGHFILCTLFLGTLAGAQSYDYGDAPDGPYPTLSVNDGARHGVTAFSPILGASVDTEGDGQPTSAADGDGADEDGVTFLTAFDPGKDAVVRVSASVGRFAFGQVSAWIDYNGDGDWLDLGEKILTNVVFAPGEVKVFTNRVPETARPGTTYARFRISNDQNLTPGGSATDGEVEDYQLVISGAEWTMDFGDAPDPLYRTFFGNNGARHLFVTNGPFMGAAVDIEGDGRPSRAADGDDGFGEDDEDGVAFLTSLIPGSNYVWSVDLSASPTSAYVNGWIDFNQDGDWLDAGEKVVSDLWMAGGARLQFTNILSVEAVTGYTYARFRCSSQAGLGPAGAAEDGEVEDYRLAVLHPAPAAAIVITNIVQGAGGIEVSWTPEADVLYQLQACYDLERAGGPRWFDVGDVVRAPHSRQSDGAGDGQRFYRVAAPFVIP